MSDLVFSNYINPPVVFDVMLATPDMASSKKFEVATVTGATDCMLSHNVYAALERNGDIRAYALKFVGGTIVPLTAPVKRSQLVPLYRELLRRNVAVSTVLGWIGTEPKTVEELNAVMAAH